jgi:hypothetical protein
MGRNTISVIAAPPPRGLQKPLGLENLTSPTPARVRDVISWVSTRSG